MNTIEDFNKLVEMAMENSNYSHMRPVVSKELLHYDILFSLDKGIEVLGCFNKAMIFC